MGEFLYLVFAFFVGAIPFAEYAQRFLKPKEAIKLALKKRARTRVYFLLDPWIDVGFNFLDILKAFFVTTLAGYYYDNYLIIALAAFAVVLGQVFSPHAKKRNRGLSCMIGSLAALDFRLLLVAAVLYGLLLLVLPYVRVSLVALALLLALVAYFFSENIFLVLFLLLCFLLLALLYLRAIQGYFAGTEKNVAEEFHRRNK